MIWQRMKMLKTMKGKKKMADCLNTMLRIMQALLIISAPMITFLIFESDFLLMNLINSNKNKPPK